MTSIMDIQTESGLSPWSFEGYLKAIDKPESIFLTASKTSGEIVGFIIATTTNYGEAEILNLGVRRNHRRKGVGTLLLNTAVTESFEKRQAEILWLEVRESNLKAIEFYRKNGFQVAGKRKNFYSNPLENALLMKFEGDRRQGSRESSGEKRET